MKTERLSYPLPENRIAQTPAPRRRDARLMAVCRATGGITHHRFSDLPGFLRRGDLLVVNDTKVIRGRLRAHKDTGASVEIFLLARRDGGEEEGETWEALARPSRRLREGMEFGVGAGLRVTLLRREDGQWLVRLAADVPVPMALERVGEVPLPPYIRRSVGDPAASVDAERYQTVFAACPGSVAAPTAGLHFDVEMLGEVRGRGADVAPVTLSVGYGTFSPIRSKEVESYRIHAEPYRLSPDTAAAVNATRDRGGRVIAVGTTSVRVLETRAREDGRVEPAEGMTRHYIYPGYRFRAVDALITNFHLPRSSLLALVMAFAGVETIREAYRVAVEQEYRFFSYGDAMFLY
ncbi:MAG TPA: tRNA preQ1(34) S-adenosylmethionine ribosyltransferase-isomerase QueA [Candidatus Limnocylindria bacterium]|nr:tRNA preQ1(34) S-adenosylmethionine ribosyltransferase-isomerase QueA [Candidatus Limnocylindria bacterium]